MDKPIANWRRIAWIAARVVPLGFCSAVACGGEGEASPTPVAQESQAFTSWSSRGINVDPANPRSRPCSDLGGGGLRVGGFVRMPVKFSSADWSWQNGGFDGYLQCLRATLPGSRIIGTVGEATMNPAYGVPSNPYYAHQCDPNDLEVQHCPQFASWLSAFLQYVSPGILVHFDIIEVFNEPDDKWNGSRFGSGTTSSMPPKAYAQLLDAFYDEFRGPIGRPVMMGGMDSGQPSYLEQMRPYRSDFVNIHPYGSYPGQTPGFHWDPSTLTCSSTYGTLRPCWGSTEDGITKYRDRFVSDGGSGALVITEWGSGDAGALAGLIHAFFDDPTTSAQDAAFFAYSDANQGGFGLKTAADQPKAAYYAFQNP
jgi:hypothetical protein